MIANASVVVPAYNERNRIESSLRTIAEWQRSRPGGWDWEVLLVDDGSTDGTSELATATAKSAGLPLQLLRHAKNRGKGAAIRTGVLASKGDPILVTDTDLSTPLSEWIKLAERLPTHPVAIGSRQDTQTARGRGILPFIKMNFMSSLPTRSSTRYPMGGMRWAVGRKGGSCHRGCLCFAPPFGAERECTSRLPGALRRCCRQQT